MRHYNENLLIGEVYELFGYDYMITRILGKGGVGVAYLAENHQENLKICIKVLNPRKEIELTPVLIERFYHEAKVAKGLSNENVVEVFDVGIFNGYHHYSSEYCAGGNLKNYLRKNNPDFLMIMDIFFQICSALNYIHQKGIHRDLKPDNVLIMNNVMSYTDKVQIKISDFGTFYDLEDVTSNPYTLPEDKIGSLIYISPEQRTGGLLTKQTDIYSLGLIFYQMIIRDTFEYRLKPIVSVTFLDSEQKLVLQNIIYKMCENHPQFRYKNVNDVLIDIQEKLVSKDSFLSKEIQIPMWVTRKQQKVNTDYKSSNLYHEIDFNMPAIEKMIWEFSLEDYINMPCNDIATESVIGENAVFTAWHSGHITSLSIFSGKMNWIINLNGISIFSAPVIYDRKLYVVDHEGTVIAVNMFSGEVLWSVNLSGKYTCDLKVLKDDLYVLSNSSELHILDPRDGRVISKQYLNFHGDGNVCEVITTETGIFFSGKDYIFGYPDVTIERAFDPWIGWSYEKPMDYYSSFVGISFDNKNLYTATTNGYVICIDVNFGNVIWKIETYDYISAPPFINDDFLYFVNGKGLLNICDKSSGAILKKMPTVDIWGVKNEVEFGVPIVTAKDIVITSDYEVRILDSIESKVRVSFDIGKEPLRRIAISNNIWIISSVSGLIALS